MKKTKARINYNKIKIMRITYKLTTISFQNFVHEV